VSRGFASALIGIGLTLLAWFGPWEWPAWPAFTVIELAFGTHTAFGELPFSTRAAVVTLLIIVNVAFWGGVTWITIWLAMRHAAHPPLK
jgi:hypothetical protein